MLDLAFPRLHPRPASGWVNDPNGLCRVDGTYHVFFQHNPASVRHGSICWGHLSSPDLLHWTEEPLALRPRVGGPDAAGCWSGCITDDEGVPTAVYTAVPDDPARAVVALARADRTLREWVQEPGAVPTGPFSAAAGEAAPVGTGPEQVRDPFLFHHQGRRYAVQGAGGREGPAQLLLWDCEDLRRWRPLGTLLDSSDPVAAAVAPAEIWECPNLFPSAGRWVLLVSLWRWVDGRDVLSGVRHLVGDLTADGSGLRFRPEHGGPFDDGPVCYAPQVLVEPDRVLCWGWAQERGRTPEQLAAAGWAGVLTSPRELLLVDGVLVSRPAAELAVLRQARLSVPPGVDFSEPAFEVEAHGPVRLVLRSGGADRWAVEAVGSPAAPARLLVDGSLVEVFAGGRCRTDRAYPGADSTWLVLGDPSELILYRSAQLSSDRERPPMPGSGPGS